MSDNIRRFRAVRNALDRLYPQQPGLFHRSDRCDLSLFQLGLRFLEYCLNRSWRIRVYFSMARLGAEDDDRLFLQHLQPLATLPEKSVR